MSSLWRFIKALCWFLAGGWKSINRTPQFFSRHPRALGHGIVVRSFRPEDLDSAKVWIDNDPFHRDYVTSEAFSEPKTESVVVQDLRGPVLAFRVSYSVRCDLQFATDSKERRKNALHTFVPWILRRTDSIGAREVIYRAEPSLAKFLIRNMAAEPVSDTYTINPQPATEVTHKI